MSFIFGVITCFAGIIGVGLGSYSSGRLRTLTSVKADPLICGFGLLVCAPLLYFSIISSRYYPDLTWVWIAITIYTISFAMSFIKSSVSSLSIFITHFIAYIKSAKPMSPRARVLHINQSINRSNKRLQVIQSINQSNEKTEDLK